MHQAAMMLRYREPAVRHAAAPRDDEPGITRESLDQERTRSLMRLADAEILSAVAVWIEHHDRHLLEAALQERYTDLTLERFRGQFDDECHRVLIDTVGSRIDDASC